MIDPTQTQPLPWREHEVPGKPGEKSPMEPPGRPPESRDRPLPDRLADRGYRLRARLGSGRLGAVYEAQDDLSRSSGSQHFVAIQLIDERIASRPGFAADFERGARELQSVSHPNIVKLLEFGRDQGRFYLVMELLESASLRFVLNDVTELPLEETSAVLRAVGDALLHLHAKGIIHGNLRPENVLVTFGYEVKLLDVVPSGWLDNPPDDLGVPARKPDKRDDVFGLACLAYEMLSGRHPYNGNTAQEAYRAGLEPAPIARLSARQWRALAGALAVHRDDRTPNVAQFLEEFGVTHVERLRKVVSEGAEPARPAFDQESRARAAPDLGARAAPEPATRAAEFEPAPLPPVLAERVVPVEERRSGVGTLVLLLLVIAAGIAAYRYQEPLREGATNLMAEIDAQLKGAIPTTSVPATKPGAAIDPSEALPRAAAVTDPEPATVLAPGAALPELSGPDTVPPPAVEPPTTASAAGVPEAPASQVAPPDATASIAAPAETTPLEAGPTRFSFAQPVATVRENEVAARIVIRRSGDLAGPASVAWWTTEGSAKADTDYADLGARVERFEPGERSRTIYVPLTNDAVAESTKSFNVYLGTGDDAREGEPSSGMRVEIIDDD